MVSAINDVGHTMQLKTVGEFVENEDIRLRLAQIGVDYGQGYGIAKPIPFEEFLSTLAAQQALRNAG
jgi:EAL domain-containing protein (putative c-di-GMP-specific phosphodiesterase class I)